MIEGSARARLGRAVNTRTVMAGQKLNLQVGDEVDFYRAPSAKDSPGWSGPGEVIDVSRVTGGVVSIRWQTKVLEVQLPYLRRHLHFWSICEPPQEDTGGGRTTEVSVPNYFHPRQCLDAHQNSCFATHHWMCHTDRPH